MAQDSALLDELGIEGAALCVADGASPGVSCAKAKPETNAEKHSTSNSRKNDLDLCIH
jgi:hypothetical protein